MYIKKKYIILFFIIFFPCRFLLRRVIFILRRKRARSLVSQWRRIYHPFQSLDFPAPIYRQIQQQMENAPEGSYSLLSSLLSSSWTFLQFPAFFLLRSFFCISLPFRLSSPAQAFQLSGCFTSKTVLFFAYPRPDKDLKKIRCVFTHLILITILNLLPYLTKNLLIYSHT